MRLIDQLWLHSARYQRLSLDHRHDGADTEHRRILSKLNTGDHKGAASALKSHLDTTVRLMSGQIDDTEPHATSSLVV